MRSLALAAVAFAPAARAQNLTILVKDGDVIPGFGGATVIKIDDVEVNDQGSWLARTNTTNNTVVLRNGLMLTRFDEPLSQPAGASIASFGVLQLDDTDRATWNLFLAGPTLSFGDDSGIYRDLGLVVQESSVSTAPQLPPGTTYTGFWGARNDGSNKLLVMWTPSGSVLRALSVLTVDNSGNLLAENVVAQAGDTIGTPPAVISDFTTTRNAWDFDRNAHALYLADTNAAATNDGMLMFDTTMLVREGTASPLGGRNWEGLLGRAIALNDAGEFVFSADVDGATTDDLVICKNGTTIVAQEGASLPAIGGFTFTGFGSGALELDNSGNVFWYGDWNDPNTAVDTGFFRNGQLVIQKGVTQVGGLTVTGLSAVQDNFAISRDGRYAIVVCVLSGTLDAAVLIDFGPPANSPVAFCAGDGSLTDHTTPCPCGNNGAPGNGCGHSFDPNGANLSSTGTTTADDVVLHSQFEPASSFTLMMQHGNGGDTVFHDGVLCASNPLIRLRGRAAVGGEAFFPNSLFAQDSTTTLSARGGTFPGSGQTMRYAAWYRNASTTFCPPATANVTNGLVVTW